MFSVGKRRVLTLGALLTSLTLNASVAFAGVGGDGIGDPYWPQDGNGGYRVGHYDVKVGYDPDKPDQLTGDTTVSATATTGLDRFNLDFTPTFDISTITVNGVPARGFAREGEHELVVTPARPIRQGARFDVRVVYSGKNGDARYNPETGGMFVIGEPHSATSWFPSNDHPSDKATFALTATVPQGWTAVGNGRPGPTTTERGRTTFRWREDSPLATWTAVLAIAKFTVVNAALADGTPVISAYAPGAEAAAREHGDRVPEIIDFLSSRFGKYPFSSAGGIYFNEDIALGLETQSRPLYPGTAWPDVVGLIVHEQAHQWFGNNVTGRNWRDICVAECFATYAQWMWSEAKEGKDLDAQYRELVAANRDKPNFWKVPLYDPGAGTYLSAVYRTGPLMLHALRRGIGDDAFFRVLPIWQSLHRGGNASWPEFEQLAQRVSGVDLDDFFKAWTRSTTIPADRYLYPGPLRP
nr:M1 family metallopeptidase [Kibdelosporangium sp. MJ126-NF4]CEL18430.1 putative metallopeptidase [Kibdelosporangium sp. MJ126-NF4]CTQ97913.1 putative metallopeptidase [Kibdelosporangium sp. MJ126-NF4]